MAIPRKDVKVYFDETDHAKIKAICDIDGITLADFIESVVVPAVEKRVHDAMMLAQALGAKGISRDLPESRGMGRNAS
jgi:hypothetical protein